MDSTKNNKFTKSVKSVKSNNNLTNLKCVYDPTTGEQNAFKLAYADLKTQSELASVVDA